MKTMTLAVTALLLAQFSIRAAGPIKITIDSSNPGAKINPSMWGIFFEDINFGADGGLYAELVKNRGFEFPDRLMGWSLVTGPDRANIRDTEPFHPANRHYLHVAGSGAEQLILVNEGFRGMGVRAGEEYDFSAQLRRGTDAASLRIQLIAPDGAELAVAQLNDLSAAWKQHRARLVPSKSEPKARLSLAVKGTLDLDMVSLFPRKTWKNRPGGLRADMVQMLADLKPGFMRFPGGCIVEGSDLSRRYQWKTTIGPVEERTLLINRWNYELKHRTAGDYFQTFGLGFFEFFQLSEDIGAEPMPILNCGMACQFNTGELVPIEQLDPYIQDALDLIEFANGPPTTGWGSKRAAMGHPAPFKLKLLGIGNEQWGPQYLERYARFASALKARHPELQLISSAGPAPSEERFQFLWPRLREAKAQIVDEHCYANPIWFFSNAGRYDRYDRAGPKVFMGEYAAQSVAIVSPENKNTLECALAEAAFMTGLERNADVVQLASYAPLFAHVDGWQWTPNLIWADNLRVYGTPSYYVQQLFSRNRGDVALPLKFEMLPAPVHAGGRIAVGTYQTGAEFKDIEVRDEAGTLFRCAFESDTPEWTKQGGKWVLNQGALQQADPRAIAWARAGDPTWSDYTLSLKARKLSGREGFLIAVRDGSAQTRLQWNLGGWGNQFHGIQAMLGGQENLLARQPGSIELERWYDIKMEIKENRLSCFLDGKLIQRVDVPLPRVEALYGSAARDQQTGEIILKAVNPGNQPQPAEIHIVGCSDVNKTAKVTTLTGGQLQDVNSLDEPLKVAPAESIASSVGSRFSHKFEPRSLTVIRLKAL